MTSTHRWHDSASQRIQQKLPKLINEFSKFAVRKVSTQKQLHLQALAMICPKMKLKVQFHLDGIKWIKVLTHKLKKEM